MLVYKSFNYRIYPDISSQSKLKAWEAGLKFLWNLAHEQRLNGYYHRSKGQKIFPSYFSQNSELTLLREDVDWINDIPRHLSDNLLKNLDTAWRKWFLRLAGHPRWKKKKHPISLTETDSAQFWVKYNKLKFPKLPPIPIVVSRPLEGKPKSCTIKRDGDQWFACIACEVDICTPKPRTESPVGIDRGVRNLIADSNGRLVTNPKFLDKSLKKLARAQRSVSRKVKGSINREKANNKVNRIYRTIRRQREHLLHVESTRYAKSHGIVVLEDLKTENMIRIGGVLSRNIADSGWGMFSRMLEYKLKWSGGTLGKVNPAYTSQTCAVCGHVDRNSRCGDQFKCTQCGNEDHADLNAPKVILARWSPACQPVEGSSQRAPRRNRKFVFKTRKQID